MAGVREKDVREFRCLERGLFLPPDFDELKHRSVNKLSFGVSTRTDLPIDDSKHPSCFQVFISPCTATARHGFRPDLE